MNLKKIAIFSFLMILALNQISVVSATHNNVEVAQAKEMIESNPNLLILDVRAHDEYFAGHILNAMLIPVGELEGRLSELHKYRPILVYCRSGVRSSTASQILVDHGFIEVYNMLGGILAWIDAGYPVQVEVSKDYGAIQVAINAAKDGDTIFVSSGIYYEGIVVNRTVSLLGEDPETTVISGNGMYAVLEIVRHNVTVIGFTIQNGTEGIYITDVANSSNIEGCKIIDNNQGILIRSSNNLMTRNVIAKNSESGIKIFSDCSCAPVYKNTVMKNKLLNNTYGIYLKNSEGSLVYQNDFANNTYQVYTVDSHTNWDNGYISGGNYWSEYVDVDLYSGPHQNETGSDGIWDHAYILNGNNRDNYPLKNPYTPFEETRVLYNELLKEYQNLHSTHDQLSSSYESLQSELISTRNLMYLFIATTILFIITIIYLATKTKALKFSK